MTDQPEPSPFEGLAGLGDVPAEATWIRHPDYGNPNIDLVTSEPLFPIGSNVAARRRALAFNAVGPAINQAGYWLPLSARKAVADAVLAAVDADAGCCPQCGRGDAGPTADQPHPTDCRCACDGCRHHNAHPIPATDDLRQQYARAIHRYDHEHALSGNDMPSDHHRGEADAVLAVRDLELEQARASRDRWRSDYAELAERHKAVTAKLAALNPQEPTP
ncbi:hypothetical protein [Streptomyces virginiae]|uniref:hypothetical protein n=1 Tax=Streptomyces virginiae TaxID=1961 RepID=UPI0034274277